MFKNYSVEMTGNKSKQNISIELAVNVLNTFSTGNSIKVPVSLTEFLTVSYTLPLL